MNKVARQMLYACLLVLLAGFLANMLVRTAPGYGVDERELDARRSASSIEAIRAAHRDQTGLVAGYLSYLGKVTRGDWGQSIAMNRPVSELFRERLPLTLRTVAAGLCEALLLSFFAAALVTATRNRAALAVTELLAGILICVPAAVLGFLLFLKNGTPSLALALALAPRLYRLFRNVLVCSADQPQVLAAHARGLSALRIFAVHVVGMSAQELLATVTTAVPLALSACVAIEVVFDSPGIGQLAWQAALARDLVLMTNVTLVIAAATIFSGALADSLRPAKVTA